MRFRKEAEEDYSLQLTPLVDVIFLLLIFFMVSTAFIDFTRRLDIQLPEAKAAQVVEKVKSFVIEMGVDKKIHLNGILVTMESLEAKIKSEMKTAARGSAIIKADKRLPYGNVVKVLGIVKDAKIRDIGIAVH
ncbi:biopolymer transporter ExbD [Nitrospinae bacterium AH_259_B05_G02_I21]|nr:biopolymer transporter ExbD [Nitrospinae bacterium AH_259_B05_G02_I21]MDA2931580.1 biopolymer transporter ExbD [Nitrospinae bacterium AH-259-F20]